MRAPDLYQRLVSAMENLGYSRWSTTLSFRDVPEDDADRLFQVVPLSVEPQIRRLGAEAGTRFIVAARKWRVSVLYRVRGSVLDIVRERVLPEEERISDLLLSLEESVSVAAAYDDTDDAGGVIRLAFELDTKYDRPA